MTCPHLYDSIAFTFVFQVTLGAGILFRTAASSEFPMVPFEISDLIETLRTATQPAAALAAIHRLAYKHPDLQVILSNRQGTLSLSSRFPLGGEGFLLSPFNSDRLTFLNAGIARELDLYGSSSPRLQIEILFDSNAAGLIRGLVENKKIEQIQSMRDFFRCVDTSRFNWNHFLYILENLEAMERMDRLGDMYETVLAAEKLKDMDVTEFKTTGRFVSTQSADEQRRRAAEQFDKVNQ
jgi:hypothetical protein